MSLRRLLATAATAVLLAACSSGPTSTATAARFTLHLGYLANLTHASAIIASEKGFFEKELGSGVSVEMTAFNAGPAALEALLSGAIDASYMGPNPAINGYAKSEGKALKVISGATSGGARLVVRDGINSAADLRGTKLATPQLGNTQDVALRTWLKAQGFTTDVRGGGDVSILPQANAQALEAFEQGQIDGAWLPEPWPSRMILEGKGHVLVDERDLWPGGAFPTTLLVASSTLLQSHPDVVRGLVAAQVDATEYLRSNVDDSKKIVNTALAETSGKALPTAVVDQAFSEMTFTNDPIPTAMNKVVGDAVSFGLLTATDIHGIFDLTALNDVLKSRNQPSIQAQ